MDAWQTILIAFGGNAALLAILGWLTKSLVEGLLAKDVTKFRTSLDKDLEQFKASLTAQTSSAVERLRHDLQLSAMEHQVRFSNLHEKRASVIAELYGRLVQATWETESFVSLIEWSGEPSKKEKYVTAYNSLVDFFRFFEKNKIYLPENSCKQIDEFARSIRSKAIDYGAYIVDSDETMTAEFLKERREIWREAWKYFREQVPPAKAGLETELRSLLGAGPSSPSRAE